MIEAISNTSPLLYLHRIGALEWLPRLFERVLVPLAVVEELDAGAAQGHDVPDVRQLQWAEIVACRDVLLEAVGSEIGPGELAVLSLASRRPGCTAILDDGQARQAASRAGIAVIGTLGVMLRAKEAGLVGQLEPFVDALSAAGMWMSPQIRGRILALADE